MTIHRTDRVFSHTTLGQHVADILFGRPETRVNQERTAAPEAKPTTPKPARRIPDILRLDQKPQPLRPFSTKPTTPPPAQLAPNRIVPEIPTLDSPQGGYGAAGVAIGLGVMLLAPDFEEWLRRPPAGDYRPTPEEGIENYLSRMREEMERAFELGAKETELRQLTASGQGDSGRAHILRQELAEAQSGATGASEGSQSRGVRAVPITNTTENSDAPTASAATPEAASNTDAATMPPDWDVVSQNEETYAQARLQYMRFVKEKFRAKLESDATAPEIVSWFRREVVPQFEHAMRVSPNLRTNSAKDLLHDVGNIESNIYRKMNRLWYKPSSLPQTRQEFAPKDPLSLQATLVGLSDPYRSMGLVHLMDDADSLVPILRVPAGKKEDLERILLNLVLNGLIHGEGEPGHKAVKVIPVMLYDQAIIEIRNNGIMDDTTIQHLKDEVLIHDGIPVGDGEHGRGWKNVRELCKKLGITWDIKTTPDDHTTSVVLRFPEGFWDINPDAFDAEKMVRDDPRYLEAHLKHLTPAGKAVVWEKLGRLAPKNSTPDDDSVDN